MFKLRVMIALGVLFGAGAVPAQTLPPLSASDLWSASRLLVEYEFRAIAREALNDYGSQSNSGITRAVADDLMSRLQQATVEVSFEDAVPLPAADELSSSAIVISAVEWARLLDPRARRSFAVRRLAACTTVAGASANALRAATAAEFNALSFPGGLDAILAINHFVPAWATLPIRRVMGVTSTVATMAQPLPDSTLRAAEAAAQRAAQLNRPAPAAPRPRFIEARVGPTDVFIVRYNDDNAFFELRALYQPVAGSPFRTLASVHSRRLTPMTAPAPAGQLTYINESYVLATDGNGVQRRPQETTTSVVTISGPTMNILSGTGLGHAGSLQNTFADDGRRGTSVSSVQAADYARQPSFLNTSILIKRATSTDEFHLYEPAQDGTLKSERIARAEAQFAIVHMAALQKKLNWFVCRATRSLEDCNPEFEAYGAASVARVRLANSLLQGGEGGLPDRLDMLMTPPGGAVFQVPADASTAGLSLPPNTGFQIPGCEAPQNERGRVYANCGPTVTCFYQSATPDRSVVNAICSSGDRRCVWNSGRTTCNFPLPQTPASAPAR